MTAETKPILLVFLFLWVISFSLSAFRAYKNGWNVKKWFLSGLFLEVFALLFVKIQDAIARTKINDQIISERSVPIANNNEVVVVDIKMPFMSMVTIMVKIAIAAIPAAIILVFIYFFIFRIFVSL